MSFTEALLDRGLVPDALIRTGIRRLLRQRIAEMPADAAARRAGLLAYVASLRQEPIAVRQDAANAQHYEVPSAFYTRVLGKHLKYSGSVWGEGVGDLDDAEAATLALYAERAALADGMRVLDLGCGWGSLSLWLAERYRGCKVTAVSNARNQRDFIEARARERGLVNLEVLTRDMQSLELERTFDRILSIEMFEHMRNWPALLEKVSRWLAPDGRLFVHVFVHKDWSYRFEVGGAGDWMARHFFTGGQMPADDQLVLCDDHLVVTNRWQVDGTHYQKTAEAWLANLDRSWDDCCRVLSKRQLRRFRVFFMACSELWGTDRGREWYVSHYLLGAKGRVPKIGSAP